MYKLILKISLIWFSIYGTVSIFMDNFIFRSIKEMLLILLAFIAIVSIFKKRVPKFHFYNITLIIFMCAISVVSLLDYSSDLTAMFIYGFKITVLPILAIFIGSYINMKNIDITKTLVFVYFVIIGFWLYQNQLGLETLLAQGYEYAVNVKHYTNGVLRLPSLVGTPDSYALLLSLLGIVIQSKLIETRKFISAIAIGGITFLFLYLSTIRSALLMFLIYEFVLISFLVFKTKGKGSKLAISAYFFALSTLPIAAIIFFGRSSLASTSSINERLDHWLSYMKPLSSMEGWFGMGLGAVGAASRRLDGLGIQSLDYAVDNQFLALYQQIGLVGLVLFMLLLFHLLFTVLKLIKSEGNNLKYICAFGIMMGVVGSCIFTNTLEIYPLNVMFYMYLGYISQDYIKQEYPNKFLKSKRITFS